MAELTVYHGSEHIVEKPEYGKGSKYNDYGLGFYCTEHIELAKEWACTTEHGGYANKYSLDIDRLSIMNLTGGEYNILNWLAILVENRTFSINADIKRAAKEYLLSHFLPDYKDYDVIIGYRADDSYFSFANAFLSNGLSLAQLNRAMYLGDLGEQIVIKSKKAFGRLHYSGYEIAEKGIFLRKRQARDNDAREAYRQESNHIAEGTYMIDIIRQEWRNEDVRL